MDEKKLKKELSLFDTILMGLGCIVGAGVFIILGKIIFIGNRYVIPGFILVTLLSIVMGYVYIEIYSRYKSEITEYLAVKDNIGEKTGKVTLYMIYLFALFTSITIIISMTKYSGFFSNNYFRQVGFSIFILVIMTLINLAGIKTSKLVCNSIGISMLVIFFGIILIGFNKINIKKINNSKNITLNSFLLITILALFLFNGYDVIIKMSGEVKEEEDTKKALTWSIVLTSIIYFMVIVILISVLGYKMIGKTYLPFVKIYELLLNKKIGNIVYIIGAVILFNTSFLTLIGASRFLYGLALKKEIPYSEQLVTLNRNMVPQNAVIFSFIICVLCILLNNEYIFAVITNFSVLYILIIISISLLIIRWKERNNKKEQEEHNYIKGNINNIPIAVVLNLLIMIYFMIVIIKNKFWIDSKLIR